MRLTLDWAFQASITWQLEEELLMVAYTFIEKKKNLLAKVNWYTLNQIKSYVRKLCFSTLLCYTRKPGYEDISF